MGVNMFFVFDPSHFISILCWFYFVVRYWQYTDELIIELIIDNTDELIGLD